LFEEKKAMPWKNPFGKDKPEPEDRGRRYRRSCLAAAGVTRLGDLSDQGYPVCPDCKTKYPLAASQIPAHNNDVPVIICPQCRLKYGLKTWVDNGTLT
jgi:hypothetical protein